MHNWSVHDHAALVPLAFERAGAALSITDPSGALLYANAAFTEMFGWRADDGIHIGVISRPDEREWLAEYVGRLVRGDDDEFHTVKRFVRRDGGEFDGHVTVRSIRVGDECVGLVGFVTPFSRRELVDDPHVAKLLEHSASTITLVDAYGGVIETAGRYRTTLDYPPEFWETRSVLDVLVPDDALRVLQLRDALVANPDEVITTDVRAVDANGDEQVLQATAENLLDDPDVGGIVITSRNVTEERAARAELAELRDQAVDEAERRSRLVATVSHELRNPLHALAGLSELLASTDDLDESSRSIASTLHREVTHMARVTDDLLAHARLELGSMEPEFGPVHLRDLVDDIAELARAAVRGRPVEVRLEVEPDVPALVETDGARLHQLVWNLVENAVKFTDEGLVTITVSAPSATDTRCTIRIEVADTGPGIDRDDLERVFDPFHTSAPAEGKSGAGLGLSIARMIAALLDGTIDATSRVGHGSTFHVEFAVDRVDGVDAASPTLGPTTVGDRPLVMVVEDNPVNQELARHQLERLGYLPLIVGSAEAALDTLATEQPTAILMDHQLPGMNGRDATRELRRRGVSTPIVGVTASATAADEQACLDAGMDAFLPKPVGLAELGRVLGPLTATPGTHDDVDGNPPAGPSDDLDDAAGAVDLGALDVLADELADPAVVASLVTTFLDVLDQRRADIAGDDPEAAAREAHSLKSSARMLGAAELADACQALESGEGSAATVLDHADRVEVVYRAWLAEHDRRN